MMQRCASYALKQQQQVRYPDILAFFTLDLALLAFLRGTAGLKARLVKPGEGDPDLMPARGSPPATRVALKSSRVMREVAGGRDEGGAPRSKGFAFVDFTSHLHALTCLRQLNNNPAYSHHAAGGAAVSLAAIPEPTFAKPSITPRFRLFFP